ncbi:MAG: late competence development ComFB family protein [Peptococcaceae bacterium]|nr:late competence development ComFB family protein [Peptococcaceae bacterium]
MRLINATELILFEQLNKMLSQRDICKCERCRLDIAAVALNNLPPNYVVSTEGEVLRSVNPQLKVDVQRQLEEAVARVAAHPHHKRSET